MDQVSNTMALAFSNGYRVSFSQLRHVNAGSFKIMLFGVGGHCITEIDKSLSDACGRATERMLAYEAEKRKSRGN